MEGKGKWFNAVKRALIPQCCQGRHRKIVCEAMLLGLLTSKEAEAAVQDAASLLPLPAIEEAKLTINDCERSKCDYSASLAGAFAAEVAAVAARAVTEVVHLTSSKTRFSGKSREDVAVAATKIQALLRGHQARKSFRALRGLLRSKRVVNGVAVESQTTKTLHHMQTVARIQTQLQSRKRVKEEEDKAVQRHQRQKFEKKPDKLKMEERWDLSSQSKEQAGAKLLKRKEAAVRRERALAYAFSHQWKSSSRSPAPMFKEASNPQLEWSWLAIWMAGRPWELQHSSMGIKDNVSIKKSNSGGARSTAPLSRPAQKSSLQPRRLSPATSLSRTSSAESRIKSVSPRGSRCSVDGGDPGIKINSESEQQWRHSIGGLPDRDAGYLASLFSVPNYMASTESARARSRFHTLKRYQSAQTSERRSSSVKKHLSVPGADKKKNNVAAARLRRLSCP